MDRLNRKRVGLILLMCMLGCTVASAQEGSGYCARNPFNRDTAEPLPIGLTDWHGEHCREYEFARAGCPQTLRYHATAPSANYWGWWVGGGTAFGGGPPCEHDGTWGWDFEGWPTRRVWLNWSHWRYQGGTGSYKTDGPKLHLHH